MPKGGPFGPPFGPTWTSFSAAAARPSRRAPLRRALAAGGLALGGRRLPRGRLPPRGRLLSAGRLSRCVLFRSHPHTSLRSLPLRRHPLQASAFPFAHSAPHPIAFIPAQRVVEAFDANGALRADPLRLPR